MKAIIMAGGQGVRLRPLTCGVPKPLVKLCGRPVVYYILDLLDKHGFTEAVFTLGYKGGQIENLFENGRYKNINLGFSKEDSPLGTAGCVKKAARNFNEDFLVISGDALCDFDLTEAINAHKASGAKATIITKSVDDPREYGLIISEPISDEANNLKLSKITGFSEKPSYLGCVSDCANTGLYVLSPEVLELIPDASPNGEIKQSDFARDIFPKMLKNEIPLNAYNASGYWKDIGDFASYSESQRDIISGKVNCEIPAAKFNEDVYTKSFIPEYVIVKSSYIGENITFGGNCYIENCVIGDNASIGGSVKLVDSIILDSVYISDGVTINGAVVCANAKLLLASSVFEGAVIGEACVIGREAVVSAGAKIWNEKEIPDNAIVKTDIKYGAKPFLELSETGMFGETNAVLTPEVCAKLGAALACVSSKIAVSCEDNNASKAMKHALIAGACASSCNDNSGEVFDIGTAFPPQLIFASELFDCGITARIKCGIFTEITISGKFGLPLTRIEERKLEAALARSEYKTAPWNNFGKITQTKGIEDIYASVVSRSYANFKSRYRIKLNCSNEKLLKNLEPIFNKVSVQNGELIVVALTNGGSAVEFYKSSSNGENGEIKAGYEKLLLFASAEVMKRGQDVSLPNDFSARADFLAESFGRKIYRYFRRSNDDGDLTARNLAAKQPFLRDGAVLALNVLEFLADSGLTLEEALSSLPEYASVRREIEINCPPQRIIARICKNNSGLGEGVALKTEQGNALLRSSKKGASLFLFAESLSSETAKELCDSTEKMIKDIMNGDNLI